MVVWSTALCSGLCDPSVARYAVALPVSLIWNRVLGTECPQPWPVNL